MAEGMRGTAATDHGRVVRLRADEPARAHGSLRGQNTAGVKNHNGSGAVLCGLVRLHARYRKSRSGSR